MYDMGLMIQVYEIYINGIYIVYICYVYTHQYVYIAYIYILYIKIKTKNFCIRFQIYIYLNMIWD